MKKSLSSFKGNLRIIGGKWRGRKIFITNSSSIRPTTNRLRETLFNWLSPIIDGANCIDCFAGSGALGLEALSRHASSLIFLEKDHIISAQLIKNIKLLQAKKARVICIDSLSWLSMSEILFDIVFIDPPFYQNIINKIVILLEKYHHLAPEAWIYIETENNKSIFNIPPNWCLYREKITKRIICRLYQRYPP